MTQRSVFAALVVLGFHLVGCGSGGGQSGSQGLAADCDSGPSDLGSPPATSDHSAMLVGRWEGQMMSFEADTQAWFFADGSCKWIDTTYYGGVEKASEYDGWLWTVAGSDLPEWDAPWIIQFRPGPSATAPTYLDEPDFGAKTLRVIAIDENGFTAYREVEGHDVYLEMTRIP